MGINLVTIPCWWSGDTQSLQATIHFQMPDLLSYNNEMNLIPLNPPHNFFPSVELPDVGELMLASFPTSSDFSFSISHNSWWMGEKYDGVRCFWHPTQCKMYSRSGREIQLLLNLECSLPTIFIDGEFWFGRGMFLQTMMLYKSALECVSWEMMRILCFDMPNKTMHKNPFEFRYELLLQGINSSHPVMAVVYRTLCKNSRHLIRNTKSIIENAGEGMILRKTNSTYEPGRTPSLIKFKTVFSDKEGLVLEVTKETVKLKLASGNIISIPLQNVFIPIPSKGDVVTFSYEVSARRESPVNPKIVKLRSDILWEDVLLSHLNELQYLNEDSTRTKGFTTHAQGYWNMDNMRQYLEDFAKKFNLDPLLPSTWYNIPHQTVYRSKGGRIIFRKFESYSMALLSIFPNIGLDTSKLSQVVWSEMKNRRQFFENYALVNKFSPLNPSNWYNQTLERIMQAKDASKVISHHNNSVSKALFELFPEIGFQKSRLMALSWDSREARRSFFLNYAESNGFDPLIPGHWYLQSKEAILVCKGASRVMFYYNGSVAKALLDVFPDIGLEKQKMANLLNTNLNYTPIRRHFFNNKFRRRKFFEQLAERNRFDPLTPTNWYLQCRKAIMSVKGASSVISYFNNSLTLALVDSFPNIGFETSKFSWNQKHWSEAANRKKLFEAYAKQNNFDPNDPDEWYSQSKDKMLVFEGIKKTIYYHSNNIATAVLALFPDIGLDKTKLFHSLSYVFKDYLQDLRDLFNKYATKKALDPHIAETWYSQSRAEIMAVKEIATIVTLYFGRSMAKALLTCFPNIGLDSMKLPWTQMMWNSVVKRRRFFIDYANRNGFDYLSPEKWYTSEVRQDVVTTKGAQRVLSYHRNKLSLALTELFPEMQVDLAKFNHWNNTVNRRQAFEKYADENRFDPLIPGNWYTQSVTKIKQTKDIASALEYYENVPQALNGLFPEVKFEAWRFKYGGVWQSLGNRRKFFENFAFLNGFDPQIPYDWLLHFKKFKSTTGGRSILRHYKDNMGAALKDLFPEVDWEKLFFSNQWKDAASRRQFFENYARSNHFDPLDPKNWYLEPKNKLMAAKGIHGVIHYYNNSINKALLELFPDISLVKSKFDKCVWQHSNNRRQFFEMFAKKNKFDPLTPENWYSQLHMKIMLAQGAHRVIHYHNDSISKALLELFPDIGLEKLKFKWPSNQRYS